MGLLDFFKKGKRNEESQQEGQGQSGFAENEAPEIIFDTDETGNEEDMEAIIEELGMLDKLEGPEEENTELGQGFDLSEYDAIPEEVYESLNDLEVQEPEKKGFFSKILSGLDKTRKNILSGVDNVLKAFVSIDEELFEELEEALIMADIGVESSVKIINAVKDRVKKEKVTEVQMIKQLIIDEITNILTIGSEEFIMPSPSVLLVIGVNGVGKTTTIGKLASIYKSLGKKVLIAAADTFRAAAIDQLEVWGKRSGVDVIKQQEGSDPAAVVFDAAQAAKARKVDLLIVDTAGRLHNKKNLMDELSKISRVISREFSGAHMEVFLVLDATTGQNAMQQAKLFKEAANITGIVLTKLDGTAKGGIIISIKNELNVPVRFIGVGEGVDDLREFDAGQFAEALFAGQK
jgi:fused signal recognition particle receptor